MPWLYEKIDHGHIAFIPNLRLICGEDGDCEVLKKDLLEAKAIYPGINFVPIEHPKDEID